MSSFASGAVFGAALLGASLHQPAAISSQVKLEDWHLLQAFLTATSTSA